MPELDPFEARLTAAVHAFADRAETDVDAMAIAEMAIGRGRRTGPLGWLRASVPVPVVILMTLGLLVSLLAWSLVVGGPRGDPRPLVVVPTPTAMTAPTATPPMTDGQGDENVTGTETMTLTTDATETKVGGVTQRRGGVMTIVSAMNDARVSGTATWRFGADLYPAGVGPIWGTYRLEAAAGSWNGTCRGADWQGGELGGHACWLTGSGAYAGYAYYLQAVPVGSGSFVVEGLIYPGPAHEQQGEG